MADFMCNWVNFHCCKWHNIEKTFLTYGHTVTTRHLRLDSKWLILLEIKMSRREKMSHRTTILLNRFKYLSESLGADVIKKF